MYFFGFQRQNVSWWCPISSSQIAVFVSTAGKGQVMAELSPSMTQTSLGSWSQFEWECSSGKLRQDQGPGRLAAARLDIVCSKSGCSLVSVPRGAIKLI